MDVSLPLHPHQIWHPHQKGYLQHSPKQKKGERGEEEKKEEEHHWIQIQRFGWDSSEIENGPSHPKVCCGSWLPASHTFNLKALRIILRDLQRSPITQQGWLSSQLCISISWSRRRIWRIVGKSLVSLLLPIAVVQSLSCIWLFVAPLTAACQASLSFTFSQNLLRLMSIESVVPSNHLILCRPLLLLSSIFPSSRVFFQWVGASHHMAKVLELQLQHQSFQRIFRIDFL